MSKKSAPNTPSRSSTREHKKTPTFQVVYETPKVHGNSMTLSKNAGNFKKVVGHKVYNTYYVEYEVELANGQKTKATEYDFKKHNEILAEYKKKVTKQSDDSSGEYVVEKVLTHRIVEGEPLYLVQWKGFENPVWNSEMWEKDLNNCKSLLASYKENANLSSTSKTPKKASNKTPKPTPKSTKRRAPSPSDDEGEDEEVKPKKTPKKSAKKAKPTLKSTKRRSPSPIDDEEEEEEEDESKKTLVTKKPTRQPTPNQELTGRISKNTNLIEGNANHNVEAEVIERVEEIQEDDDDDEQKDVPSTSNETKSRWGFGSWRFF